MICGIEMWCQSTGILKYEGDDRLVVQVDQGLGGYHKLIPKAHGALKPRYATHITVVRTGVEIPVHKEHWGKYDGQQIDFLYSPVIQHENWYYWLDVLSVPLEEIRLELGLCAKARFRTPPEGFRKYFHITIGNTKHENPE